MVTEDEFEVIAAAAKLIAQHEAVREDAQAEKVPRERHLLRNEAADRLLIELAALGCHHIESLVATMWVGPEGVEEFRYACQIGPFEDTFTACGVLQVEKKYEKLVEEGDPLVLLQRQAPHEVELEVFGPDDRFPSVAYGSKLSTLPLDEADIGRALSEARAIEEGWLLIKVQQPKPLTGD